MPLPWPIENIDNTQQVSRHFSVLNLTKDHGRRFPSEANFIIQPGEDGLSVYWNKFITLRDIYITIGLSHNQSGTFKDYTALKIFTFNVDFIRSLNDSMDVLHDPVFRGNPSPVGSPNIRSHSLIAFGKEVNDEDFLEIRLELSDYCKREYDQSYMPFDVKTIKDEIATLRARTNDTPYHKE